MGKRKVTWGEGEGGGKGDDISMGRDELQIRHFRGDRRERTLVRRRANIVPEFEFPRAEHIVSDA